jgi:RimJ/RimL family protein N-acetyltransferase
MKATLSPTFRTFRSTDVAALVKHASNRNIWLNVRDRFPHPYTPEVAEEWIAFNHAHLGAPLNFAVEHRGHLVGCVGIDPFEDERRLTAEVGYWIGEPFWGLGLATSAARFVTSYAFATFPFERLQASVYDWNPASARVLEKAGFALESRQRRAVVKEDRVGDVLLYALLRT